MPFVDFMLILPLNNLEAEGNPHCQYIFAGLEKH